MSDNGTWQPPAGEPEEPPRYGQRIQPTPEQPAGHDGQQQQPTGQQQPLPPQQPYGQQPPYGQQAPYGQVQPPYVDPYGRNPFAGAPGAASAGWAPPPKPGLIPLRPLSFGTLMGAPFQELRRNPKATVGSALIVQGITVLLTVLVMGVVTVLSLSRIDQASADDVDEITSGVVLTLILAAIVPIVVSYIGSVFVQGVVVSDVARGTVGEKMRMGALWKATWPRLGWLLLWTLLYSLAVLVALAIVGGLGALLIVQGGGGIAIGIIVIVFGVLLLIALGVWLFTKLAVVPSVIVMERASLRTAVARSWQLTTGSFWKTFGVLFLIASILGIAAQVITTPVSLVIGMVPSVLDPTNSDPQSMLTFLIIAEVVLTLVTVVIAAITAVVQSAAVALIYIDLRMRREGLDIELIRFVEARQLGNTDVPDPYLLRSDR